MDTPDNQAPILFVELLNTATQAHLLHFKTRNFAAHNALENLYEKLPELVDRLVEAYQGIRGLITSYPTTTVADATDELQFVAEKRQALAAERDWVGSDSELQNIVDEILALLDSTIYKLRAFRG